jgi:uncharacterized membrane-anchored protein YitT (DUF2179 family)
LIARKDPVRARQHASRMAAHTNPGVAPAASPQALPPLARHTLFDDAQAILTGTLFAALGLVLFRHAGLMTGGSVGLALLAHYATGVAFGLAVFAINIPFYFLAWARMGRRFTLKTLAAVALLAILSERLPGWIVLQWVHPLFAAIGGGLLVGAGLLILFRHQASLGGFNVLVLWLQERFGWRAGVVQMLIDAAILLAASPWLDAERLVLSIVGAAALNFALAVNHRPGRYTAF